MRRLALALFLFVAAAPAWSADNGAPGLSQLQVTDCNGTPRSVLATNIANPTILLQVQDALSGLHLGRNPLIAGSSTTASTHLFWSFDAGGTVIADDSANNERGIFQGTTGADCVASDPCFETAGGPNGAFSRQLHFRNNQPATNTSVFGVVVPPAISTASLDFIISNITIETWINPDTISLTRPFVEFSTATGRAPQDEPKGVTIRFNTGDGTVHNPAVDSGKIWVNFISSGSPSPGIQSHVVVSTPILKAGTWHLMSVTYDRSLGAGFIYVDGVRVASQALGSFALRTDAEFRIGYSSGSAAFPAPAQTFLGRIDQFRVLARAISSEEHLQAYQGPRVLLLRAGAATIDSYLPTAADWNYGETGLKNFSRAVSVLTGGPTLNFGDNAIGFFISDRAGNVSTLISNISFQATTPGAPVITSMAPVGAGQITYTWTRPFGICTTTAPQYKVYDCQSPIEQLVPGVPAITSAAAAPTFTEDPPPPDTNVKFGRKIAAVDVVQSLEGSKSGCGQTYTNADAPTSLTSSNVSTGSLVLTWGAGLNPNYTRYILQRFPTAARLPADTITIISQQDAFTGNTRGLSGLDPGTTYFFRVFAVNGSAADLEVPGGVATAVRDLDIATRVGVSTITGRALSAAVIKWDWRHVTGADRYRVINATNTATILCAGTEDALCTLPGPHCECQAGGYTPDTRVSAFLIAEGPAGDGDPSPAAAAFTLALQPTGFAQTAVTSNTVSLAWGLSGNNPTTNYEIRRSTSQSMFGVISTASAQGTSAVLGGLLPASTYFFQLRARNGDEIFTAPDVNVVQAVTDPAVGITASSGPATTYEAPAGAMALWHFDESTGTRAYDTTPNRHDGLLTCAFAGCISTPTFAAGPDGLGTALRFVGQSDSFVHVTTSPVFDAPPALTIEAWLNPSTAFQVPEAAVIAKGSSTDYGYSLDVDNAGAVSRWRLRVGTGLAGNACGVGSVCLNSTALLDPGKWHHVIAVWDPSGAGTQTIYIDGAQNATQGLGGNTGLRNATKRVTIGNRPFGGTSSFNAAFAGSIDELRVLNRAINATEAADHYGSALAGTFAPPPPNQNLRLTIPPNAFSAPVRFYVSNDPRNNPLRTAPPAIAAALLSPPKNDAGTVTTLIPGSLVEFVAQVNGVAFTDLLASSVTVSLPYTDNDGNSLIDGTDPPISVATLRVYLLEETPPRWIALGGPISVDTVLRRVSGRTPHFSVFALFGTSGIGSSDEVNVYPVPWRPGSGGGFDSVDPANCNGGSGLCFDKLPTNGTIRIYTITGEQVVELAFGAVNAGRLGWNGKNAAGRTAASGVYFARVNGFAGGSRILKFAIER